MQQLSLSIIAVAAITPWLILVSYRNRLLVALAYGVCCKFGLTFRGDPLRRTWLNSSSRSRWPCM